MKLIVGILLALAASVSSKKPCTALVDVYERHTGVCVSISSNKMCKSQDYLDILNYECTEKPLGSECVVDVKHTITVEGECIYLGKMKFCSTSDNSLHATEDC
jgi:hypothetical protein